MPTTTGAGKGGNFRIEVKTGFLAAIEGAFGRFTNFAGQVQLVKDALGRADLVAGDLPIGLANGSHHREGRIHELVLQALDLPRREFQHGTAQQARQEIGEQATDNQPIPAADHVTNEGTDQYEHIHAPILA